MLNEYFYLAGPAAHTPTTVTSEIHLSHDVSVEDRLVFRALNDQSQ